MTMVLSLCQGSLLRFSRAYRSGTCSSFYRNSSEYMMFTSEACRLPAFSCMQGQVAQAWRDPKSKGSDNGLLFFFFVFGW